MPQTSAQANKNYSRPNITKGFIRTGAKILGGSNKRAKKDFRKSFWESYESTIIGYIHKILNGIGDDDLCGEIAHEFMCTILDDDKQHILGKYNGDAKFTTYLYVVCKNFVFDWLKENGEDLLWSGEPHPSLQDGLVIKFPLGNRVTTDKEFDRIMVNDLSTFSEPGQPSVQEILKIQECLQFAVVRAEILLSQANPSHARVLIRDTSGVSRTEIAQILAGKAKNGPNAVSQMKHEAMENIRLITKRVLREAYDLDFDMLKEDINDFLGK